MDKSAVTRKAKECVFKMLFLFFRHPE